MISVRCGNYINEALFFYGEGPFCETCIGLYEQLESLLFHQSIKEHQVKTVTADVAIKMDRNIRKRHRRTNKLRRIIADRS